MNCIIENSYHYTLCIIYFILSFNVAFNTVYKVISRWLVLWAEETSTYSWSRFCTVNCQPMASNYLLCHLRSGQDSNSDLRGGRRECYHCATMAPHFMHESLLFMLMYPELYRFMCGLYFMFVNIIFPFPVKNFCCYCSSP